MYDIAEIEPKDEAFNYPVIHEMADILADLPQDNLRILHRTTNQFPNMSEDITENIANMIELIASSQQTTYDHFVSHKVSNIAAENTLTLKHVRNKGRDWMICWENGTEREEVLGKEDKIIGKYIKILINVEKKSPCIATLTL